MQYPEDDVIEKINEQTRRIQAVVSAAEDAAYAAREELAALRNELGETLLRAATGDATQADVDAMRAKIEAAHLVIEDNDLISEPANRALAKLAGESQKASRKRLYREEYESLKTRLADAGSTAGVKVRRFLELCENLNGSEDEARSILAKFWPEWGTA